MSRLKNYLKQIPPEKAEPGAIAYLASLDLIESEAPSIAKSIIQELSDQRSHLKMIASENYSSLTVQLAMGNLLTDKYSEGYPHHRFYAGCENVDSIEDEANKELKLLFGCEHSYVQPHSGCDANLVAYWAVLVHKVQSVELERLGKKSLDELTIEEYERIRMQMMSQTLLGMSLNSGGHLTHGYRHNVSAKMMRAFGYDINPATGFIDYSEIRKQALEIKPTILMAGYSAYPGKINFAKMREIADEAGAVLMVDMAHFSGLVAGKVFTGDYDPVPFADIVTSTTHKTLRGPRGGLVLCKKEYAEIIDKGCPLVMGGALPHVIAAKAIAFKEANRPEFKDYTRRVVENAKTLANELSSLGLKVLTGGTENHMVLIDLSDMGITGRQAEKALLQSYVTVNRNAIPFDPNGSWYTSGVRIGTPALTTRGMGVAEMKSIASIISDILRSSKPGTVKQSGKPSKASVEVPVEVLDKAKEEVETLLKSFPLYPEIVMMEGNEQAAKSLRD